MLVGTQMVAKGHDFPGVRLVGVVAADVGLHLPDFRAAERTFQLLTQVAGRAGRDARAGPRDRADLRARSLRDAARARPRLRDASTRRSSRTARALGYPPFGRLAQRARLARERESDAVARRARSSRAASRGGAAGAASCSDPRPRRSPRLRGRHRQQLLIKGDARRACAAAARAALAAAARLRDGRVGSGRRASLEHALTSRYVLAQMALRPVLQFPDTRLRASSRSRSRRSPTSCASSRRTCAR